MLAEIYWITDFLATILRPRGNDWLEFEKIVKSRGCQVPDTQEQIDWVKSFARKINEN